MDYDARTQLKNYVDEISKFAKRSRGDLLDCMRRFRSVIEQLSLEAKYPTLYFYCNWAMHPGIAKNRYGYEMLVEIDRSFIFGNGETIENMMAGILKALSLSELYEEVFALLDECDIDSPTLKNDWSAFQKALLDDLLHRTISLPENIGTKGAAFDAREQMRRIHESQGLRTDFAVYKFYLSFKSDDKQGRPSGYYFNVTLHDSGAVTMNGHLL